MSTLFSKHAREMMKVRGVSKEEVEKAIKKGSKQFQKPDKILAHYRYFCVVYKRIGNTNFVITVKPRW